MVIARFVLIADKAMIALMLVVKLFAIVTVIVLLHLTTIACSVKLAAIAQVTRIQTRTQIQVMSHVLINYKIVSVIHYAHSLQLHTTAHKRVTTLATSVKTSATIVHHVVSMV